MATKFDFDFKTKIHFNSSKQWFNSHEEVLIFSVSFEKDKSVRF